MSSKYARNHKKRKSSKKTKKLEASKYEGYDSVENKMEKLHKATSDRLNIYEYVPGLLEGSKEINGDVTVPEE